jgi:hypothetical protein
MKTITIALGLVIVMGVLVSNTYGTKTEVIQQRATTTIEVMPEWAEDEDAVKAAQDVIRRKELEAEKAELEAIIASTSNRIDEIDKELGVY